MPTVLVFIRFTPASAWRNGVNPSTLLEITGANLGIIEAHCFPDESDWCILPEEGRTYTAILYRVEGQPQVMLAYYRYQFDRAYVVDSQYASWPAGAEKWDSKAIQNAETLILKMGRKKASPTSEKKQQP